MGIVVGIDIGGSTTKICGFDEKKDLIHPLSTRADDPVSSIYGAFGKFTSLSGIALSDIERIMVTGVGSSYISENLYGIPTKLVREFDCIGLGGRFLASLEEAIVVSMGTGTAMVHAKGKKFDYLGGTGVGGGTLIGLSKAMLGISDVKTLSELAARGDLSRVNLNISDISRKEYGTTLTPDVTASNFGKLTDLATREDLALGIMNLVFETVGMMSVFAARQFDLRDVVLLGHLAEIPAGIETFRMLGKMFDMNFIVPEKSQFGTVIGAALLHFEKDRQGR